MEQVFLPVKSHQATEYDKWLTDMYSAMVLINPEEWPKLECYPIHELRDKKKRLVLRRADMIITEDSDRYNLDALALRYAST
jgi:hypothetical protein